MAPNICNYYTLKSVALIEEYRKRTRITHLEVLLNDKTPAQHIQDKSYVPFQHIKRERTCISLKTIFSGRSWSQEPRWDTFLRFFLSWYWGVGGVILPQIKKPQFPHLWKCQLDCMPSTVLDLRNQDDSTRPPQRGQEELLATKTCGSRDTA